MAESNPVEKEIEALSVVYRALSQLDPSAQARVISYVTHQLRGSAPRLAETDTNRGDTELPKPEADKQANDLEEDVHDDLAGISPVARKWMTRNSLPAAQLSAVFSLGADEIDLVAKNVPGEKTKERMKNILLLEGMAAYLSNGAARFEHEKVKDACLHYKAFDSKNFSHYLKSFTSEISGNTKSGYTLTTRGIAGATELIKSMGSNAKK